jgi:opacity protein-like surface antigen
MNTKLAAGFFALIVTGSLLHADAPVWAYTPPSGQAPATPTPDPKDMKGMTQLTSPPQPASTDAGYYVSAYGGAQFMTHYGDNLQASNPDPIYGTNVTTTKIHSNYGGVGGVKFGYLFQSWAFCDCNTDVRWQPALEADALYIGQNSHVTSFAGPGSQEKFSTNSGDFFINGILRLKTGTLMTPYIGAGAGLQYITTHGTMWGPGNTVIGTGLDTSDLDFAAQGLAGFDFQLCPHISVFTEYKFIDALGTDGRSTNLPASSTYRFKPDQIQQHLITAGVTYDF